MAKYWYVVLFILAFGAKGCIEKFNPPEITQTATYLVVEGFFNPKGDSSTIRLSRTRGLGEKMDSSIRELGASVFVEGAKGRLIAFTEKREGGYVAGPELLDSYDTYRLRVKTKSGKNYVSRYVSITNSPEIDSISYTVLNNRQSVPVMISTRGELSEPRFYRWEYTETWQYNAAYRSFYEIVKKGTPFASVEFRKEDVYTCWKSVKPTYLILGSSVHLSQNEIRDYVLTTIPVSSGKLEARYSIFVRQFALSREEFDYWTALSRTSEQTGSIFDPTPGMVRGNIYSELDRTEPVFGYFSVGKPAEKRFFIDERFGQTPFCSKGLMTVWEKDILEQDSLIVEIIKDPLGFEDTKYRLVAEQCADCRVSGGVIQRPSFW